MSHDKSVWVKLLLVSHERWTFDDFITHKKATWSLRNQRIRIRMIGKNTDKNSVIFTSFNIDGINLCFEDVNCMDRYHIIRVWKLKLKMICWWYHKIHTSYWGLSIHSGDSKKPFCRVCKFCKFNRFCRFNRFYRSCTFCGFCKYCSFCTFCKFSKFSKFCRFCE